MLEQFICRTKIYILEYYFKLYPIIKFKWTIDLNLIKFLEENEGEKSLGSWTDKNSLYKTQKVQPIKNNKLFKIKN